MAGPPDIMLVAIILTARIAVQRVSVVRTSALMARGTFDIMFVMFKNILQTQFFGSACDRVESQELERIA